jgi:hypothetical protein
MRLATMPIESVYRVNLSTEIFVLHCRKRLRHVVKRKINGYAGGKYPLVPYFADQALH